jgi:hypothetical protein
MHVMWKIFLAFVAFAALGLFIMKKSGADIDMGGEKHGADAVHSTPAAPATAPSAAPAPVPAASK